MSTWVVVIIFSVDNPCTTTATEGDYMAIAMQVWHYTGISYSQLYEGIAWRL